MVECLDIPDLLPRHGHILQQFVESMGDVLQSPEIDSLVLSESLGGHVSMVLDYLPEHLRRQQLLLIFNVAELASLTEALGINLAPLFSLVQEHGLRQD